MTQIRHWAIFGSEISMKSSFIQNLLKGRGSEQFKDLDGKKGALFSTYILEKFIKEEAIHDDFSLSHDHHRSIRTFSNGEQKKALLNHLISSKPDFLMLDNAFDMLDTESQKDLLRRLTNLSNSIPILQIVKRKDNLLPFIQYAIKIQNNDVLFSGTVDEYYQKFDNNRNFVLEGTLPPPLTDIIPIKNPLVEFRNVMVKYGERIIVKDINWKINDGDFWQLTGPNGSGKTTLLTMITGENPKAYGQDLVLFGRKKGSGESIWDIRKKIGYVTPSMTTLFRGWNTVEKMVISGLVDSIGLYGKPTEMQRNLARQWIKLIGLDDLKHERFSNLSEGQQCMVLIARSMIKHPPLLILDEPSHGLDDYNASVLSELVNKIAGEGQTTIIYVSHRKEPGLNPTSVFELVPGENGSKGRKY